MPVTLATRHLFTTLGAQNGTRIPTRRGTFWEMAVTALAEGAPKEEQEGGGTGRQNTTQESLRHLLLLPIVGVCYLYF